MSNFMDSILATRPTKTAFNLSHEVKLSTDIGMITPIFCQEVIPGDVFKINVETLVRFAPMIAPIMHRVNVKTEFFYVPFRLLWDDYEDFLGGGKDGTANPPFPTISITGMIKPGSLCDYLGLPVPSHPVSDSRSEITVSILPFRAYWMIWNEYYRDQNLTDEISFEIDGGSHTIGSDSSLLQCKYRAWEKDYFTSALPWPQRLPNPVSVPVVGNAPVSFVNSGETFFYPSSNAPTSEIPLDVKYSKYFSSGAAGTLNLTNAGTPYLRVDNTRQLSVNLSDAASVNVNELRRAFALQRWLELSARSGSRLTEVIYAHFGERVPDGRLQRPEFLGAIKTPVVVSEVMQTSASDKESTPQGNYAGVGTSYGNGFIFKRKFVEPGLIIGLMTVIPRSSYQQGIPKIFKKFDRFDYYWPQFAHLGEQEIKNYELYYEYDSSQPDYKTNDSVFGYTPRYAEYRFINSSVHGDFTSSLNFWHMGRIFSGRPGLNTDFITCQADRSSTGLNRVFAVTGTQTHHLWCQLFINCKALRPLPKYGTPGL